MNLFTLLVICAASALPAPNSWYMTSHHGEVARAFGGFFKAIGNLFGGPLVRGVTRGLRSAETKTGVGQQYFREQSQGGGGSETVEADPEKNKSEEREVGPEIDGGAEVEQAGSDDNSLRSGSKESQSALTPTVISGMAVSGSALLASTACICGWAWSDSGACACDDTGSVEMTDLGDISPRLPDLPVFHITGFDNYPGPISGGPNYDGIVEGPGDDVPEMVEEVAPSGSGFVLPGAVEEAGEIARDVIIHGDISELPVLGQVILETAPPVVASPL